MISAQGGYHPERAQRTEGSHPERAQRTEGSHAVLQRNVGKAVHQGDLSHPFEMTECFFMSPRQSVFLCHPGRVFFMTSRQSVFYDIPAECFFVSSRQSVFLCHPGRVFFYDIPAECFFMSSRQSAATRDLLTEWQPKPKAHKAKQTRP